MKSNKGFVISTTLYSIFGIMLLLVFYILYALSNNRMILSTSINDLKKELETNAGNNYSQDPSKSTYIHFGISKYLEDSYNNEVLKKIETNLEDKLKHNVDIGVSYTNLSGEETSEIEAENSVIYDYSETNDSDSSCGKYHFVLGNYALVTKLCTSKTNTSTTKYSGNPQAYLINVYNATDIISLFPTNMNYVYPYTRSIDAGIDNTNKYLYVKLVTGNSLSAGKGSLDSTHYIRIPYDSNTYNFDDSNIEYGYRALEDGKIQDSTSNFTTLNNGYKNATLKNLHENPHEYPSNYTAIYQAVRNKEGSEYYAISEYDKYKNTFYNYDKKGILIDVRTWVENNNTRELHMIWYKDPTTYKEEILTLMNPNSENYLNKFYIFIKDDDDKDMNGNHHFTINGNIIELEDYEKLFYTGMYYEPFFDKFNNIRPFPLEYCYKDIIPTPCSNIDNVEYLIEKIVNNIEDKINS